ncbi:hypothetical protein [Lyngbya confervoides]|uniref:ECF transporter S component n=1 Tax=Lyngbya confervoides BDU141951 TaxID=1574623 RepID=A0ABD4T0N7_9CYAN|nr:hypothetical protein [Lyngbya confervoides]MCM1981867.1 hypothetical protein [Lyngbya confervoides BDU141951]
MTLNLPPDAEERQVQYLGSAALDGSPIAYVVVLAAVITALAFIPFSFVVGASGGGIPLSSSVFPLLGWILGPIAGALASTIGSLVGVFLAPYTAGIPAISVAGAAIASFAAGAMRPAQASRRFWWVGISGVELLALGAYISRAVLLNGVEWPVICLGAFVDGSALLLFILPTRQLCGRWIGSPQIRQVALGLFLGTWMASGLGHLAQLSVSYFIFNWPQKVWLGLIPVMPLENLIRCVAGTVIGTGVIAGLRAIDLVKPREAIY